VTLPCLSEGMHGSTSALPGIQPYLMTMIKLVAALLVAQWKIKENTRHRGQKAHLTSEFVVMM